MSVSRRVKKSSPWQLRVGERRSLLLVGDFLMALVALALALYFWALSDRWLGHHLLRFLQERPPIWFFLLPFFWILLLVELYDMHRAGDRGETLRGIILSSLLGLTIYFLLYFLTPDPTKELPRRWVVVFVLLAALFTLAWRLLYIRVFTAPQFMRRVLLVGGGKTGQILLSVIADLWPPPFFMVGIIDDDPDKMETLIEDLPVIGASEHLPEIVAENQISDIIVAISGEMQSCMFQALLDAQERGVEIIRMPVAYEELLGRVPIQCLEADWILRSFVDHARVNGFFELGKRLVDILGGLIGTIVFALFFPFIALAIVIDDGTPIFYSQSRSGRGGQPYDILKFRTMFRNAEPDGTPKWAKEDDQRATRIGRILRKTHLDEIPQFLNVLRGDMSLVGPRAERPELMTMFEQHVPFYRARLLVKPGITGWAQVNFGYASTIPETMIKLEYDLYYIKHRNMLMDLIILLRTPGTVLGFRGR
jgi:exopolysaccharide biosynthesis polyprenyl glycosylphosphotransferase